MIPKPLNEIEWSDIEALRDSGREEDDTIEYKSRFSGGSDYLAFNEAERKKAIKGIARAAVAFLNGRGGDIVIGVQEATNKHPKIEEITPVKNIDQTVDSLAQALAADIEPTQSVLGFRAVRKAADDTDGVIIVRCPSSLRAPHRFKPTKECYVRRGRFSVPMPMDEVQDLTLRKADMMADRLKVLDAQFSDLSNELVGRQVLDSHRIHIRTCFVPSTAQQIELNEATLNAFRGHDPLVNCSQDNEQFDVAFRNLNHVYKPILRGMSREGFANLPENDFSYCSKVIRSDGVLRTDFACRASLTDNRLGTNQSGFYSAWFVGYLANTLRSFAAIQRLFPALGSGILRVAIHCGGPIIMRYGSGGWGFHTPWQEGIEPIPDFPIDRPETLLGTFHQLQLDIAHIAGLIDPAVYHFVADQ